MILHLLMYYYCQLTCTRKFRALCTPYPMSCTSEEVDKHVQLMIRAKLIEEHKVIYIGTICKVCVVLQTIELSNDILHAVP